MKFLNKSKIPKTILFQKFHGLGNDFIFLEDQVLDLFKNTEELCEFAKKLCNRNFSIGADGLVFFNSHEHKLLIINSDGSFAGTCGNALRCYGLLLLIEKNWDGTCQLPIGRLQFKQSTQFSSSDKIFATLLYGNLITHEIAVSMGTEKYVETIYSQNNIWAKNESMQIVFVCLANPHLVFISNIFKTLSIEQKCEFGLWAQKNTWHSKSTSIPVCNIGMLCLESNLTDEPKSPHEINTQDYHLTVYERGAGLTLCCGSGTVAARVALEQLNLVHKNQESVGFLLPGGQLKINWAQINGIQQRALIGLAKFVYKGSLSWD